MAEESEQSLKGNGILISRTRDEESGVLTWDNTEHGREGIERGAGRRTVCTLWF